MQKKVPILYILKYVKQGIIVAEKGPLEIFSQTHPSKAASSRAVYLGPGPVRFGILQGKDNISGQSIPLSDQSYNQNVFLTFKCNSKY